MRSARGFVGLLDCLIACLLVCSLGCLFVGLVDCSFG